VSNTVTIKVYDDGAKVSARLTALRLNFTMSCGRDTWHYTQFTIQKPMYSRRKHVIEQRRELERMQDPLYKW